MLPDALAGLDILAKSPTGSGKTLAFGLPLIARTTCSNARPAALAMVPTRELAVQVAEELTILANATNLKVATVYGGVSLTAQAKRASHAHVIVGTPGRLFDLIDRRLLSLEAVNVLVLDEADRMLDMGFRPQVDRILKRVPTNRQTMLFSATLDGAVDRLVQKYMVDPVFHEVASDEPTVEQMRHHFLHVHQLDKVKVAAAIARGVDRTMIFRSTKRGADKLVEQLQREGVRAGAIHGDLRQAAREQALADFAAGRLHVLVAKIGRAHV